MIIQCPGCRKYLDDQYRSTICPHDTFAANDGKNRFAHHAGAYLADEPPPSRPATGQGTVRKG